MNERLKFARSRFQPVIPGIGKNCSIHKSARIAETARIDDNVVIEENVIIGHGCWIFPGAVIGASGFGFEREADGTPIRIHHSGGVIIGNNVEIGANSCVVKATLHNTVIQDDVKIDTLCIVAHNVFIDQKTLIASGVLIGGSANIGRRCFIGTGCSIKNKITVGNDVTIGQHTNVVKDVHSGLTIIGNPGRELK